MTRSVTSSLAQPLSTVLDVHYLPAAKPGTFFARDNVHNFISWCKNSLNIIECLLFETDDLIMRKNEKHVVLCLLEVARRGAKFGMLAPMLVQMERQIDREIAAEQRLQQSQTDLQDRGYCEYAIDDHDDTDSELEYEHPTLMYGPAPQIVTNDLKGLDEMVRELVEACTCPTQFPMIRVSEGKYRIGDTKILIFVRILRNHVMVRVGGGWDTLSHYLDKHDPCRCRSQHRSMQGARLVSRPGVHGLVGAQVYYDRSPPRTRRHSMNNSPSKDYLGPPVNAINRSRSRSPTPNLPMFERRSMSPAKHLSNIGRSTLEMPNVRSRSPTPHFVSTQFNKFTNGNSKSKIRSASPTPSYISNVSPKFKNRSPARNNRSSSPIPNTQVTNCNKPITHVSTLQIPFDNKTNLISETSLQISDPTTTDCSDNVSEVSDEGYRSLGIIQPNEKTKANTLSTNHNYNAEAEYNGQSEPSEKEKPDEVDYLYQETTVKKKACRTETSVCPAKTRMTRGRSLDGNFTTNRSKSVERWKQEPAFKPKSLAYRSTNPNSFGENNTWNGSKSKHRPSITADTYNKPNIRRNTVVRTSIGSNYDQNGRRVHSTSSSPTKSSLCQEIMRTAETVNDDQQMVQKLKNLLKQYGTFNSKADNDFETTLVQAQPKQNVNTEYQDNMFSSPRKDPKSGTVTKIPGPAIKRSTVC